MDQNLRGLFERALDDEPVPPPGDLARAAMAQGARLRRRRRLIGGGATVLSLAVAAAGALALAPPPAPTAAAPCPSGAPAPQVAVFLDMDATDDERRAVAAAIGSDPRVVGYRYETSEQAFERFEILWRDQPRVVASTGPDGLPASFRVELADPARYAAFRADVDRLDGVADVIGSVCR